MDKNKKLIAFIIGGFGVALIIAFIILTLLKEKTYIVSFDTQGGNIIESQKVTEGMKVTKPTDPVKDGYLFARWEYENTEYNFNAAVNKDMTLKAVWQEKKIEKEKYELTFTVNGKEKKIEVEDLSEIDLDTLGFEEKSGYELKWYVDGKEYDFTTPLTENVSLEGKYVKVNTLTVKFNSDGGSKVANQNVKSGEKASEPTNVTKVGYILDGWYLNNKKYDFDTPVTKAITLVAKWSEDPEVPRYIVTFDYDNGTKATTKKVIENQLVTAPTNPTKKGYVFVEWQLDGVKFDFKNTKITKDITLKASYRELAKYKVTFEVDGIIAQTNTVEEGNTVSKIADPSKKGYLFVQWLLDTKPFDFNTKITKDITLKAEFIRAYTVSFSDGVKSQIVKEGSKATKPADPKKDGNTFKGWLLNGEPYDFNTPVTSDISLTAKWEEIVVEYKITAQSVSNTTNIDVELTVWDGNNKVNAKDILVNGQSMGFTWNRAFYETINEFTVVLQNGKQVRATKK